MSPHFSITLIEPALRASARAEIFSAPTGPKPWASSARPPSVA